MITAIAKPATSIPVFPDHALSVVSGANEGDALSFAEELQPGDIYAHDGAGPARLAFATAEDGSLSVARDSVVGVPGHALHLDCCATFMDDDGLPVEVLVLVEVDDAGHVEAVHALPLAPLEEKREYQLVGADRDGAARRFAEVACVAFTRGTRITLATGAQCAIEDLTVGDRVLTRDAGAQEVRWIGQSTVRAVGEFAPILITAGTLNNENDLLVSPDHRLFIYQRSDTLGAGRSELLVKARHLVNGQSVVSRPGGFVEYFQLLFDRHQIIYAEGIAAETLLVDSRTRPALPEGLDPTLAARLKRHGDGLHDLEVGEALLDRPDAAALLRAASRG
ncbi:Hint domain-containing protein [Pseudooceanicola sp. 502str34]